MNAYRQRVPTRLWCTAVLAHLSGCLLDCCWAAPTAAMEKISSTSAKMSGPDENSQRGLLHRSASVADTETCGHPLQRLACSLHARSVA